MRTRMKFWPAALAFVAALAVQTWAQTQPARSIPPAPLTSPATQPAAATQPTTPPAVQTQPTTPPAAQPATRAAQPATRAASPALTPPAAGEKPATPAVGQPAAKRQPELPAKRAGEAPAEPKKAVPAAEPQKPAPDSDKTEPEAKAGGLDFMSMVFVFMLATFIGIGVIRRVSRLLHTPLMSLTNAISAIAVVGSLMLAGGKEYPLGYKIIGAVAMFASMTNIISGFLITDRMLKMFKTRQGGKA